MGIETLKSVLHRTARSRFVDRCAGFFLACLLGFESTWAADLPDLSVMSQDGRWVLRTENSDGALVMLDADRNLVRRYAMTTLDRRVAPGVSALLVAPSRHSFVVVLHGVAELWEISIDPEAGPIFDGLVHDYKMGESIGKPGFLGVRRTPLEQPFDAAFFDPANHVVLGTFHSAGQHDSTNVQAINLDVRRSVESFTLRGVPRIASSTHFIWNGTKVLAVPDAVDGSVNWVDTKAWKVLKTIASSSEGATPVAPASGAFQRTP